ncbi:putative succinyl-CoA transferase [Methyloligella halotolerans]|uniref:Putative succinyl-CoA transferase n=1 Tax=Methyloligella halotolerans TaxID=1177755 RepID=A0A1E2S0Z3_9HYPH|nr:GNAT family N-acetyltransferase [Methyloligella halotolerans]ODA68131.1 putative succinyl-CoA transferase [Methyloligella halotolerans]
MRLRTLRLILRPLSMGDAGRIALLAGDRDIARMTASIPHPYSEWQASEWLKSVAAGEEGTVFAIESDGKLIGCTGYRSDDGGQTAEVGYWVGKPFWGQGFATEAVAELIVHAFATERFDSLLGGHFEDNPASARVLGKLGFARCGEELRESESRDGKSRCVLYRLARADVAREAAR